MAEDGSAENKIYEKFEVSKALRDEKEVELNPINIWRCTPNRLQLLLNGMSFPVLHEGIECRPGGG